MNDLFIARLLEAADSFREVVLEQQSDKVQATVNDLTIRQQRLLRVIYNQMDEHPEGVSLKTLADLQKLSSSAVSVMVENLVQRDILERNPSPVDRRKVLIRIAGNGWNTILQLRRIYAGIADEFLSGLEAGEREFFVREIERLRQFSSNLRKGKK